MIAGAAMSNYTYEQLEQMVESMTDAQVADVLEAYRVEHEEREAERAKQRRQEAYDNCLTFSYGGAEYVAEPALMPLSKAKGLVHGTTELPIDAVVASINGEPVGGFSNMVQMTAQSRVSDFLRQGSVMLLM